MFCLISSFPLFFWGLLMNYCSHADDSKVVPDFVNYSSPKEPRKVIFEAPRSRVMIVFPNCKINLGLNVISKRPDGFHNIETVFYPVSWCDALEVIENTDGNRPFQISQSGLAIDGKLEENIVFKTWQAISKIKTVPNILVHLHKTIPMGAGLGGGSSDAAFFIQLLNDKFQLNLPTTVQKEIASGIGSDCSFFLENTPVFASGKGDILSPVACDLSAYYILLVKPNVHSNTKEAYAGLTPQDSGYELRKTVQTVPVPEWKNILKNDFEATLFKKYPVIETVKNILYNGGALYASMSGSGAAVYGIFKEHPHFNFPSEYSSYLQLPGKKNFVSL